MHTMTLRTLVVASLATAATIVFLWKRSNDNHGEGDDTTSTNDHTPLSQNLPPHLKRELYKEQRRKEKIPFLAMKSPMYDNIRMLDPDGRDVRSISTKKARWYVNKQLAEWTTPSSIQLLFEPRGRDSNDTYAVTPKRNICVACGSSDHIMRHYVVPYAYRSLLPEKYKSHQSHDIVILCPKCHLYCEQSYREQMNELEEDLRTDPSTAVVDQVDPHKQHVRSAALALLRWKEKLPENRIEEYDTVVRDHLGVISNQALSEEQLQQAIDVEYRVPNPNYISGAELVANDLMQGGHDKIADFVKEWRTFFLETVQPRHLPHGWQVDAPVNCSDHKAERAS